MAADAVPPLAGARLRPHGARLGGPAASKQLALCGGTPRIRLRAIAVQCASAATADRSAVRDHPEQAGFLLAYRRSPSFHRGQEHVATLR